MFQGLKEKLERWRQRRAYRAMSAIDQHRDDVRREIVALRLRGVVIGEGCYVAGVSIMHGDPVIIGNRCVLTRCTILAHDAAPSLFISELDDADLLRRRSLVRQTTIGNNCFIGVGAIILCGRSIGPYSIVAAGAVVTSDVPEGVVVAGNPAKRISSIESYVKKHRELFITNPNWYPVP